MLEFLRDRILNDPFERQSKFEDNPRQLALEIIIKQTQIPDFFVASVINSTNRKKKSGICR
ncbi:MAG: hypothetical protein F6K14_05305 [Symploca sp. SIO2C1]|nr:hypothetical protein [Symploca sp. SIO2C1]